MLIRCISERHDLDTQLIFHFKCRCVSVSHSATHRKISHIIKLWWSVLCFSLLWRHNWRDSVSYHQRHDCSLNRLFRRRSRKTSKLRVTGLCEGNSPGTDEFPAQMASNAEKFPFDGVAVDSYTEKMTAIYRERIVISPMLPQCWCVLLDRFPGTHQRITMT